MYSYEFDTIGSEIMAIFSWKYICKSREVRLARVQMYDSIMQKRKLF